MTSIYTAMQKGTLPALILAGLISFHSYPTKAERVNVEIATQVARVAINGGKLSTRSTNDIRLVYQPTRPKTLCAQQQMQQSITYSMQRVKKGLSLSPAMT